MWGPMTPSWPLRSAPEPVPPECTQSTGNCADPGAGGTVAGLVRKGEEAGRPRVLTAGAQCAGCGEGGQESAGGVGWEGSPRGGRGGPEVLHQRLRLMGSTERDGKGDSPARRSGQGRVIHSPGLFKVGSGPVGDGVSEQRGAETVVRVVGNQVTEYFSVRLWLNLRSGAVGVRRCRYG